MTPSSQLARGARKPAMNTPPMAGVRMKYWYMNALSTPRRSLPPLTATRTVLASVMATGTQRALVWTAIHGNDSQSWSTCTGLNAARNAAPMLMRSVVPVALAVADDVEVGPDL